MHAVATAYSVGEKLDSKEVGYLAGSARSGSDPPEMERALPRLTASNAGPAWVPATAGMKTEYLPLLIISVVTCDARPGLDWVSCRSIATWRPRIPPLALM